MTYHRPVMGTTAYAIVAPLPRVRKYKSWTIESKSFMEADRTLANARKEAAYDTPCSMDPNAWAVKETDIPHRRPKPSRKYLNELARSAAACYGCLMFKECSALLETIDQNNPIAIGVIAGVLVDPTEHGDLVRRKLHMPKRPTEA